MNKLAPALCLLSSSLAFGQSVDAVLTRMDAAAPKFHSATADLEMVTFTALISDKTDERGTLKMQRLKSGEVRAIVDFPGKSDARTIAFLGEIVRIYYPNARTYQDFDVGKNADVLNQFLLLGFGSSGNDLAANYEITAEGQQKVADRNTTKLLLLPKSKQVKDRLSKIEIWVPDDAAYPVQQKFYEPSGNYRIVTYYNVRLNAPIKGALQLNLPRGVRKQGT
jgi:outer membrane lipoprotein-sorting protein